MLKKEDFNPADIGSAEIRWGLDTARKGSKDDLIAAVHYQGIVPDPTYFAALQLQQKLRDPGYTKVMNNALERLTESVRSASAAAAAAADAINLSLVDLNVKKLGVVEHLRAMYAERKRIAQYKADQKRWRDDPLELKKRFLQPFINEQAVKIRSLGRTLINLSDRLQDKV